MAVRVVVLADTHMLTFPRARGRLPDAAWSRIRDADAILHAGDVLDAGLLDQLGDHAPVHAVLGNNDTSLIGVLPLTRTVDFEGVRIAMIHDSGPTASRARRMKRRFPDAHVVVFGHSHAPVNELGDDGQLLFNPGSPTQRRAQPMHTIGELRIQNGRLVAHSIIPLD